MKTVRKTAEYTVQQRGDGRYAVRGKDKKWINGDAKVEILVKEGLLKEQPRPKPQPAAEEAPTEEVAPAEEEAPADASAAGEETEEKTDEAS